MNPKVLTVQGRLNFPKFTAQEAYESSLTGNYKKDSPAESKPSYNLLLTQDELDKVRKHLIEVFIPYCVEQGKKTPKDPRKTPDGLSMRDAKLFIDGFNEDDPKDQLYHTPLKRVPDKTLEKAPESVAMMRVVGPTGGQIKLVTVVTDPAELVAPTDQDIQFPQLRSVTDTNLQIYPGVYGGSTLEFYVYDSSGKPGINAAGPTFVRKLDMDSLAGGGGPAIDESVFLEGL